MNLPADFLSMLRPILDGDLDDFVDALSSEPVTSIRLNAKPFDANYEDCERVPWCPKGRYLAERPRFTSDPLLHAGCYYVQEASSMFLYQALLQYVDTHSIVLDMCAAPGGKSTLINDFLAEDTLLVTNEYVSQRAHILVENMTKWGRPNTVVTNNVPQHFECLGELFDAVCVDAPCSGEGMFRKDEKTVTEWSPEAVGNCVARQRQILQSAWSVLRPGGVLIYSTCTYNRLENEENVQWLIDEYEAEFLPLEVADDWNIIVTDRGYRFMPHRTRGEGLFMAVLRKPEITYSHPRFKLPKRLPEKNDAVLDWLSEPGMFATVIRSNTVCAIPLDYRAEIIYMLEHLNVMSMGIAVAEQKGRDLIPHHALAMSTMLNRDKFTSADVDYDTAISYLRTEALSLSSYPKGFLLITYQNVPLGWVKNIGSRSNNLYPTPWRIRF